MARQKKVKENGAALGFEEKLWLAADKLRGHMDAAEYKHVVLGLVFLKYISDAFQEHYDKLTATPGADPEDRDEYTADRVFWVPKEARWGGEHGIQAKARQPTVGKLVDDAMVAIEKENAKLKGVLVASRSVFSLFSLEEETSANSQLWNNLLVRTCTTKLWAGDREGRPVKVWGRQEQGGRGTGNG